MRTLVVLAVLSALRSRAGRRPLKKGKNRSGGLLLVASGSARECSPVSA